MKSALLWTLFIVAAVAAPISIVKTAELGCESVGAAQMRAEMGSEQSGGTAIRLGGDEAERFLQFINFKVGRHTEYWGNGVIISRYPALGYDAIAIVDGDCVDESKLIRLDPETTALAMHAAGSSFE